MTLRTAGALVAMLLTLAGIGLSSALLNAYSANPNNVFQAASSFAAFVSLSDPGANLRGTVTLNADAYAPQGINNVRIQRSPAGAGTWTDICTDAGSPYSCSFVTTGLADGVYDLRAVAQPTSGIDIVSTTVASRKVDNTDPTGVTITVPAGNLSGSPTFSAAASDALAGVASVAVQYAPTGTTTWTTGCTATVSPYSCSFDTAQLADGLYDFRSLATDNAGNQAASATSANKRVDNFAPTASFSPVPSAYMLGTIIVGALASDGGGIASVVIQRSPAGAGTWTNICTDTISPYSCSFNTTNVTDGLYDLRVVATDNASRVTTTAVSTTRVDNTDPTATMTDPGSPISGVITLNSTVNDAGSGLASVRYEAKISGGGNPYFTICTPLSAPWSCTWNTGSLADGLYDVRVVATDYAGNAKTAGSVNSRMVDNTAPTGSLTDPGANLRATVTLNATASDAGGVQSVAISWSPAGQNTWTSICSDTISPYSCAWDTTARPNGYYDLRAVITDNSGFQTTSTVSNRRIDNTAPSSATMADPGSGPLSGTLTLSGSAADADSGPASLAFQYRLSSGGAWATACSDSTSPYSCTWDSSSIGDGSYDFQSLATDNAGNTLASSAWTSRIVDNFGPVTTMTAPAATMRGTVSLGATATDAGTGVAGVTIQRSPTGQAVWTDVCTDASSPYACSFDTTGVADGLYDFRATSVDNGGRTAVSAVSAGKRVDNTAPSVDLSAVATYLRATPTIAATASDAGSGVLNVAIQRSPAGAASWTTICTDASSPYSCAWNTTGVTDGLYDLRAVATDNAGNATNSALVTNRTVDNTKPSGQDVQTQNGGLTAGVVEQNDKLIFTYTEAMAPGSFGIAGWDGSSVAVTLRLVNSGANEKVQVWNGANTTELGFRKGGAGGDILIGADFVTANVNIPATMTLTGAVVTITLGTPPGTGFIGTPAAAGTISWPPDAVATDLAGNAANSTTANESGALDAEF